MPINILYREVTCKTQMFWVEILTTVVGQLGSAGTVFSQIPLLVRFWVSAGHRRHLKWEGEVQLQPYSLPSEGQGQAPGPAVETLYITADPLAGGGAGVAQHPDSPHLQLPRDLLLLLFRGMEQVHVHLCAETPASPATASGLQGLRHRCRPQLVSKVTVDFIGLQFISVSSLLSATSSFLPHLPIWLVQRLHVLGLTWGAEPTAVRDCTTSSHTCRQV